MNILHIKKKQTNKEKRKKERKEKTKTKQKIPNCKKKVIKK